MPARLRQENSRENRSVEPLLRSDRAKRRPFADGEFDPFKD
jgi:hypothetical protein